MLLTESSTEISANIETVWAIYENIEGWPSWDHELEWVKLEGKFEAGAIGKLKPNGGPIVPFEMMHVERLKSFQDVSKLPGGRLIFTHTITQTQAGSIIKHRIELKGLLSFLYRFIFKKKMQNGLPIALQGFKKLAEQKECDHKKARLG
jgi:polyketide cyclase/dehydrase/lipid transport protein